MSRFFDWCVRNQDAITWFLVGWLSFAALDNFVRGEYVWAAFDAFLVYVNCKLSHVRLR